MALEFDNQIIEQTKHARYLGIHIDQFLSFDYNFRMTIAKAKAVLIALYPLAKSNQLPLAHRKSLVKNVLHPIMFFAAPAWSGLPLTKQKKLASCFGRIARILLNLHPRSSTAVMLDILGYQSILEQLANSKGNFVQKLREKDIDELSALADKIEIAWPHPAILNN